MSTPTISPQTWWLTGLSGAGKTTLSIALAAQLRMKGLAVCILDGDELRQGLCRDLGFSPQDRQENMRRAAQMARLINDSQIHAIVALISPTNAGRQTARAIIGPDRFIEVHVATPLSVCAARDTKGLYARALSDTQLGLTGVQAAYEAPVSPHAVIDTSVISVEDAVARLVVLRP
jgi:adenylylsulfate kinase